MEFDSLTFLIMAIFLLAAVLASIAALAPHKTWVRVNALVFTLLIMPIGFLQVTEPETGGLRVAAPHCR